MKLYEFFKAKEEPKHQNLCVGEGVISLQDACIPLDNICAMEITLPPAMPFGLGIFFIIVGILELLIPYSVIRILGVLVLLIGIGYIFLIQYINQKRKYSLKITVNSGLRYGFESPNIEYMRNLLRLIQQAIDDRRIQFFADVTNTYINNGVVSESPSPLFYWLFSFPKFHFHLYFSVTFTTFSIRRNLIFLLFFSHDKRMSK